MLLLGSISSIKNIFQLLNILFIFIFVLVLTYYTTKWIAKYQHSIYKSKNIKIIETFRITNNKYIQIIEVGTKYLVISICKDTMNVLTELEKEQLIWMPSEFEDETGSKNQNFQQILNKLKEKIPKK